MSYCTMATCLPHRRAMFWSLQENRWVHADCWPCLALDHLGSEGARLAVIDGAVYVPRDRMLPVTDADGRPAELAPLTVTLVLAGEVL